MTSALIVIDMQNWFFRTTERADKLRALVPAVNALVARFARTGMPMLEVRTEFSPDRATWSMSMRRENAAVLIAGTRDTEPVPGLQGLNCVEKVVKTRHSAFLCTDLESRLRSIGVDGVVLCGAFLDGCVGLTAIDAAECDFEVGLGRQAIAALDEDQGKAMLAFLEREFEVEALDCDRLMTRMARADPPPILPS